MSTSALEKKKSYHGQKMRWRQKGGSQQKKKKGEEFAPEDWIGGGRRAGGC